VLTLYRWSKEKDKILKKQRGTGFEDIIEAIDKNLLDVYDHPNKQEYPNQKIYVVKSHDYVFLVPFVRDGNDIFLKTIIPSRKAKKIYKEI
jgi:mRNA-degrading endonuclease RelE of RelBE toxin-antitoxin system